MKRYIRFYALLLTLISANAFSHDEHVHQHIVREAYNFLVGQKGEIPELNAIIGWNFSGGGTDNDMWGTGLVIAGAWQEDFSDPVFGINYAGQWTLTHFWDADASDDSENYFTGLGNIPNAYLKARVYLYGYGNNSIVVKLTQNAADLGGIPIAGRIYRWDSLIDFYNTGRCYSVGYIDLAGNVCSYSQGVHQIYMYLPTAHQYAACALGRAIHLLSDMSV